MLHTVDVYEESLYILSHELNYSIILLKTELVLKVICLDLSKTELSLYSLLYCNVCNTLCMWRVYIW